MKKILNQINEEVNLSKINKLSIDDIKNSFFANYLAGLLILKMQDLDGLLLLNDPLHSKLTKFNNDMSIINYWGRILFYSIEPEIKFRLTGNISSDLYDLRKDISDFKIQNMLNVFLLPYEEINWSECIANLALLQHQLKLNSSYANFLIKGLASWDCLPEIGKQSLLTKSFMYLLQSDNNSKLLPNIERLNNKSMLYGLKNIKPISFTKLKEDGEGAISSGEIGSTNGAESNTDNFIINPPGFNNTNETDEEKDLSTQFYLKKLSPYQLGKLSKKIIKNGKIIVKKVKKFNILKFKAPEHLKK